jgi:hypothetical protein
VSQKYSTCVERDITFHLPNGKVYQANALLDSGATHASYITPSAIDAILDLCPAITIHHLNSSVNLADGITTSKVSGIVHLNTTIHGPVGDHHGCIPLKIAALSPKHACFVGLPTLCTLFKTLFIECIESFESPDKEQVHNCISKLDEYVQLIPQFLIDSYEEHTNVWSHLVEQEAPEELLIPQPLDFAAFIAEESFAHNKKQFLSEWQSKMCPEYITNNQMTPEEAIAFNSFCHYMEERGHLAFMPGPSGWSFISGVEVSIDWDKPLPTSFPCKPVYPPHTVRTNCDRYIDSLLKYFWVPSDATTLTPILIVPKPGSEFSVRIVAMYNKTVNNYITNYVWAIPSPLDKAHQFLGCRWFGTGDLTRAFHQLRLSEDSSRALSVATHRGNFRPCAIPEGVKFGSQYLQQVVMHAFADMESFCDAIYDNLFFYAPTLEEFLLCMIRIFDRCIEHNIVLSLDKTKFGFSQVQFGMQIDGTGYTVDPTRIDAIRRIAMPTNVHETRSALGLFNWLSPFVPNYAVLAAPIHDMTKSTFTFDKDRWDRNYEEDFIKLREACSDGLIKVGLPDYTKTWITYSDASEVACCGVIVMLNDEGTQIPIQIVSHKFTDRAFRWDIIQKEAYSIFFNYVKGKNMLLGKAHKCMTDHANLLAMEQSKRRVIQNIVLFLQQFNIEGIWHVAGTKNPADYATRAGIDEVKQVHEFLLECTPSQYGNVPDSSSLADELHCMAQVACIQDSHSKRLLSELLQAGRSKADALDTIYCVYTASSCHYYSGYAFDHLAHEIDHIAATLDESEALSTFHSVHNSTVGHWGLTKTMFNLDRDYPEHGLTKEQVSRFLLGCHICAKTRKALVPAVIPLRKDLRNFQIDKQHVHRAFIMIDFVDLPVTASGNVGATIIANGFSKSTRIYPQVDNTAESLALTMIRYTSSYGLFVYIRSDQGSDYMSKVFQRTREILGRPNLLFVHITSLPYRPQGHGTETHVKLVVSTLRKCVNDPHWPYPDWDSPLAIATVEVILNFSQHSITKQVPIAIDTGTAEQFFPLPDYSTIPDASDSKTLNQYLTNFKIVRDILYDNHQFLHDKNVTSNTAATQDTLKVGQFVYHHSHDDANKLAFIRKGPFQVMAHDKGTNEVHIKDMVRHSILKAYSGHLSVFTGTPEDAIQASRLDNQQYEITRILGYRGDPEKRTTMEFLILFADNSEVWRTYDQDLDSTIQYETFCSTNHELRYLLRLASLAPMTRKWLRSHPFVIEPQSSCYVNLRSWGQLWYSELALPDVFTQRYVVKATYGNTLRIRGRDHVEVSFPIFEEHWLSKDALDFEWISLWGRYIELDPSWIVIDEPFVILYPQVLPESTRTQLLVRAQRILALSK